MKELIQDISPQLSVKVKKIYYAEPVHRQVKNESKIAIVTSLVTTFVAAHIHWRPTKYTFKKGLRTDWQTNTFKWSKLYAAPLALILVGFWLFVAAWQPYSAQTNIAQDSRKTAAASKTNSTPSAPVAMNPSHANVAAVISKPMPVQNTPKVAVASVAQTATNSPTTVASTDPAAAASSSDPSTTSSTPGSGGDDSTNSSSTTSSSDGGTTTGTGTDTGSGSDTGTTDPTDPTNPVTITVPPVSVSLGSGQVSTDPLSASL